MTHHVYIETLGCSKNQVDSEMMLGLFQGAKYLRAAAPEDADIILVNTCGFIEKAKEESIETILALAELKTAGSCKVLLVTGCLAERYAEELAKEIPEVDAFIGTTQFDQVVSVAQQVMSRQKTVIVTGDIDKAIDDSIPRVLLSPSYTAFLKIAEGCDNFCTYCIIPKLRGKYRSRELEDILREAQTLVKQGIRELVVIAQDTTRYGQDKYGVPMLPQLLEKLNAIEGLEWIRLQYCYPDAITDALTEAIRKLDKVCKYIDIPIQHCNDEILKRMNRHTSRAQIKEVISKLRAAVPEIAIRTTLIVGFPGETEAQFDELMAFVDESKFERLGAFAYSQEEDTPAALLGGQIEEDVKQDRLGRIMGLQQSISLGNQERWIGKTLKVLIEEAVEGEAVYIGRTQFDSPEVDGCIYVNTEKTYKPGSVIMVRVTDAMEYEWVGVPEDEYRQ